MTNDEIEAVRDSLRDAAQTIGPGSLSARVYVTVEQLLARAEQAERERDEAKSMADMAYVQAGGALDELAARDAAIAEIETKVLSYLEQRRISEHEQNTVAHMFHSSLRQIKQPEPDKLVEVAQEAFSAMLRVNSPDTLANALRKALAARGGRVVFDGEGE